MNHFLRICALLADIFASFYLGLCVVLLVFFPPMSICLCLHGLAFNDKMMVLFFAVLAAYVFLSGRQTLGKRMFRLHIVDKDSGQPANWLQIFKRHGILVLSLGMSYFWLIFSKGQYTLHDKLSNTTVSKID